jgi:hypothetical protein
VQAAGFGACVAGGGFPANGTCGAGRLMCLAYAPHSVVRVAGKRHHFSGCGLPLVRVGGCCLPLAAAMPLVGRPWLLFAPENQWSRSLRSRRGGDASPWSRWASSGTAGPGLTMPVSVTMVSVCSAGGSSTSYSGPHHKLAAERCLTRGA